MLFKCHWGHFHLSTFNMEPFTCIHVCMEIWFCSILMALQFTLRWLLRPVGLLFSNVLYNISISNYNRIISGLPLNVLKKILDNQKQVSITVKKKINTRNDKLNWIYSIIGKKIQIQGYIFKKYNQSFIITTKQQKILREERNSVVYQTCKSTQKT